MVKNRLEAFSDGVIAIIITIMVLELKVPHGTELADLQPLIPVFFSYVLSFIYVGIYWNNHHHLLHTIDHVSGGMLWANLHLLFWLSLIPFATGWMGENHFSSVPLALYGFMLLMCAVAWLLLQRSMVKTHDRKSPLAVAVGRDIKGKISPVLYVVGIVSAFFNEHFSEAVYVLVALMWLVPDRRFERASHGT
ncbi:TMEM175 family protein [Pyxidicoccus sp. MSG2]|uniref:TMEM175 family protein n=1 Tax=Pyxidicoccus sp. MSG2 TaxID=2996790 RepID=UPI00226FFCE7|nr:TMEM175 family protein [Pyxidicoccus sp. MSG2]MCY1021135.1 TMEM175 family protein [Pyxidicoccus sp. MSG2]